MEENKPKVVLIGAKLNNNTVEDTDEASIRELEELVKTAKGEVVGSVIQNVKTIDPATYIGKGKVEEIKDFIDKNDVDMAVFDTELSGSVTKNLENDLGVTVIDRSRLILDIFAMRAKSREGKCQVELAQLKYILPRLSGIGQSLSRLGGGIGTRGPGETKLETDRRHIRRRIEHLSEELSDIEKHRSNLRRKRINDSTPFVVLVGYTNVGKSSLLNLLSASKDAYVENQLFATLDPLMRKIKLNDTTEIILCDTVGFIRKLPHHLIEAFKSTLEEIEYADLIIHLADASSKDLEREIDVVEGLIKELNKNNKPVIRVFNKCDMCEPPLHLTEKGSISISVKSNINIDELKKTLENAVYNGRMRLKVLIPFADGGIMGIIYKNATVLSEEATEKGFVMEIICDDEIYYKVKDYKYE